MKFKATYQTQKVGVKKATHTMRECVKATQTPLGVNIHEQMNNENLVH